MKKKILITLLLALLLVLTMVSCAKGEGAPKLKFSASDGTEILLLSFEDGEAVIESVGSVDLEKSVLKVDRPCINGSPEREALWRLYEIPEDYFDLAEQKTVKGVLVYYGFVYCVVEEYDMDRMYRIGEHPFSVWEPISWSAFYDIAVGWNAENSEASGGDGLGLI